MPPPPPTPEPRHPGGQPNNTNALKHGFYARKFKPHHLDDYTRATQVTGLAEEIALLRLVILNLAGACLPEPGAPPDLAACHALEASLARLSHLLKDQRFLALGTTDPAGIIAALFADANAGLPFTHIFSPATACATSGMPATSPLMPPDSAPVLPASSPRFDPLPHASAPSTPVDLSAPPSTGTSPLAGAYPPSFPPPTPLPASPGEPLLVVPRRFRRSSFSPRFSLPP